MHLKRNDLESLISHGKHP